MTKLTRYHVLTYRTLPRYRMLPSISGLDANTLVEIVDMFPGDWTLNELIIVGAQTIFGEILDMQPVPDWFDGIKIIKYFLF